MVFDRGNKKWTSMMLPEHVQMVKDLNVDYYRQPKPQLDEQQVEQINETFHIAMEFNLPLVVTVWDEGFFSEVEGVLHYINEIDKAIHMVDIKSEIHKIKFDVIAGVEYAD